MPDKKWLGFWIHFVTYGTVIGILFFINAVGAGTTWWFQFPALGWGAGLAIHFWSLYVTDEASPFYRLSKAWKDWLVHAGVYVTIITMLMGINLSTDPQELWFVWPAGIWGIFVVGQLATTALTRGKAFDDMVETMAETGLGHPAQTDDAETHRAVSIADSVANDISDASIRGYLEQARTYRTQISQAIASGGRNRPQLQDINAQLDSWVQAIQQLAQRVDDFRQNFVIQRDLQSVPAAISKLEARLAQETDADMKVELEKALANRQHQWASLEQLQRSITRAEARIESTVSALGTMYSQILTSQSTDHVADYSRLAAQMDEEVNTLHDHLEALEDVKLRRELDNRE